MENKIERAFNRFASYFVTVFLLLFDKAALASEIVRDREAERILNPYVFLIGSATGVGLTTYGMSDPFDPTNWKAFSIHTGPYFIVAVIGAVMYRLLLKMPPTENRTMDHLACYFTGFSGVGALIIFLVIVLAIRLAEVLDLDWAAVPMPLYITGLIAFFGGYLVLFLWRFQSTSIAVLTTLHSSVSSGEKIKLGFTNCTVVMLCALAFLYPLGGATG